MIKIQVVYIIKYIKSYLQFSIYIIISNKLNLINN